MVDETSYSWRGALSDAEMVDLVSSYGGNAVAGWWDQVRSYSLGWVVARDRNGVLVGFVNVAWDGGDHAFLIDTKTRDTSQHRGIATTLVRLAAAESKAAGCEWLHVDYEARLASFYLGACGFQPTSAGLIHLFSLPAD